MLFRDLDEGVEEKFTKFLGETKLGGVANTLKERKGIGEDLDRYQQGAGMNRMESYRGKL